jgi:DNA polymerase-1
MIAVDAWLQTSGLPARLIMQVHDELILEVADSAADSVASQLRRLMSQAAELAVPLKVDIGMGPNWDVAH